MFGAAFTIVLSFLVFGYFFRRMPVQTNNTRFSLQIQFTEQNRLYRLFIGCIKVSSVLIFILCILTGLFGAQTSTDNFTPTMVWIIFWVGMYFISALIGNLWPIVNPWLILYEMFSFICRRFCKNSLHPRTHRYPNHWLFWPAIISLIAFAWMEIIYPSSFVPRHLSIMILIYSIFTWGGMWYFGKSPWTKYGEFFSVAFSTIAKLSPVQVQRVSPDNPNSYLKKLVVRPHGSSLFAHETLELSKTLFILVLLGTVTFDGLSTTPIWENILTYLTPLLKDIVLIHTLGYLILIILFASVYFGVCRLMILASGEKSDTAKISEGFIYSLVPIAIAYHIAHYTSFMLIQGQLIIPLISDPFGFKWDILGTANYEVYTGIINAQFIWYLSIIVIVIGHMLAVFISHFQSVSLFSNSRAAMKSQLPMLILMVGYTMVSLWIISQPIIK